MEHDSSVSVHSPHWQSIAFDVVGAAVPVVVVVVAAAAVVVVNG